ncbi:putative integral membrane protein [Babesia bovis T2Bo]|uniref:Uncharacterized protein n=1 Tax=Babesia bovis TaxID=5865 RepID=A7AQV0_BABBO|nr:putative integral membrane protein [Babesia bovis T2Bo]EDO06919.1 putative integral membrane protein [Babesia bovis T2Bo]BAN65157.1 hypothetical protein [Babesia bovis]|eukprot:XP_001610487.1 hypothetical protein [Babesia bovis T2Bo]
MERHPEGAPMHTDAESKLRTGDVGTFHTIYDANGAEIDYQDEEKASNWLKRKVDKGVSMGASLPMYKKYIEHDMISKDRQKTGRRLNKYVRRLLTVLFCFGVAVGTYMGSTKVINWAEDKRKGTGVLENTPSEDVARLLQTIESLRVELNKVKEATYANSVAINSMTNGAFRLPGNEEAAPKKAKFGKGKPSINQGYVSQNFDAKQFAYAGDAQAKDVGTEVNLNPIVYEADIH